MRRLITVVALALALPLTACADNTAPEDTLEGIYNLETINGIALPWLAVQVEGDKIEVTCGSITLGADGTFTDEMTFMITEGGVTRSEQDIYTGTYLKSTTGATLSPVGFEPYMVSISGSTMTQLINDFELTYRR
jgi:hypothetical protein